MATTARDRLKKYRDLIRSANKELDKDVEETVEPVEEPVTSTESSDVIPEEEADTSEPDEEAETDEGGAIDSGNPDGGV